MELARTRKNLSKQIFILFIFIYLITIILWFSNFKIKDPSKYDMEDVFFEGLYLLVSFICLILITRLKSAVFNLGWGIFVWGLIIDFMDEFTSEPSLFDTEIEGIIITTGLIVITYYIYTFYFQQKKLEKKLTYLANHDSITKSYNRHYFNIMIREEEKRSKRYNHNIGLIMIDIDRFKELNDRFGHQAGDKILRRVARFLKKQVRSIDRVIRYGGDEFLIVLPEAKEDLSQLKERLIENFKQEQFTEIPPDFGLSFSIGFALWRPGQTSSLESMIDLADKQMYQEKAINKNEER